MGCSSRLLALFLAGGLFLVAGCVQDSDINQYLPGRHYTFYTNAESESPRIPSLVTPIHREIDGEVVPATRFRFPPESLEWMTAMTQKIPVHRDHRLTGIRFPIRSLTGPCTLRAVIMPVSDDPTNYICDNPVRLTSSGWQTAVLNLSEFSDTRSRMGVMQDVFFPGEWDSIKLLLIPGENTGEEQVFEWGPLEAVRHTRRYRFH